MHEENKNKTTSKHTKQKTNKQTKQNKKQNKQKTPRTAMTVLNQFTVNRTGKGK